MNKFQDSNVEKVFNHYPAHIAPKMMHLRQLILDMGSEIKEVDKVAETLKWGEPSYLTKHGSTVRIGWKSSQPTQYAIYFHCQTTLVDTFRELYSDQFNFEGNRAILFNEADDIPIEALKHCIALSFTYHLRKHLPLLGA